MHAYSCACEHTQVWNLFWQINYECTKHAFISLNTIFVLVLINKFIHTQTVVCQHRWKRLNFCVSHTHSLSHSLLKLIYLIFASKLPGWLQYKLMNFHIISLQFPVYVCSIGSYIGVLGAYNLFILSKLLLKYIDYNIMIYLCGKITTLATGNKTSSTR